MTGPLNGFRVALAEGRQLEELAALLEQEGASIVRCPMLSILDAPEAAPVETWLRALIGRRFDLLILMTGEAVRRLLGFAERAGLRDKVLQALAETPTLCRGPKPGHALKEVGLKPSRVAQAPTTDGVIASLRDDTLSGKHVGVTLYGSDNPVLVNFLTSTGAIVHTVLPYVYAPAADEERIVELIGQLDAGEIHILVFTSSPQVDRVWEVAGKRSLEQTLNRALPKIRVAAVGPLVADALRKRNAPVHICPEQGWVMKNLVRQIVRAVGH